MKHFKKIKLLFVAIALFSYSHICHAGDTGDESVVLWYTNGEKTCYLLSSKPVITYNEENLILTATDVNIEVARIIRKSKFPQNPKRSVRFSGKRTKRSVQKRKARNTQKAETKVL